MRRKKSPRTNAQAALEYLMTYGWALVLIVTIASVLFVFTTGGYSKNTCQTISQSFFCKGVYADGDTAILKLQNASARKITINPFTDIAFDGKTGYAKILYGGQTHQFDDVTIPAGETFEVTGTGMALSKGLSITYTEVETGYTKTVNINLTTDAPPTTEISNDGVNNDGKNGIDCADPYVASIDCRYVISASNITATTISFNASYSELPNIAIAESRILVFKLNNQASPLIITENSTSSSANIASPKIGINNGTFSGDSAISDKNPGLSYSLNNPASVEWAKLVLVIPK